MENYTNTIIILSEIIAKQKIELAKALQRNKELEKQLAKYIAQSVMIEYK